MKFILIAAACAVAGSLSCTATAATVSVSTAAQLSAALKSAKGGDIIKVAPGNYGDFDIRAVNPASAVNIVSANSARPPVFSHLIIRDSSQLRFTRMIVNSSAPDSANPSRTATEIYRSSDIRMAGMVFSGVAGGSVSSEPRGLRLSQSSSITVAGSTFTDLSHGIVTDGTSRMTITDNAFSRIRTDGIIADGASTSLIARNRFSSFRPEGLDHPDAIQIFNNFTPTYNLTVTDNLMIGDADGQMQGIFMTNAGGDRSQLDRIVITNNLMWGTMWNGIASFDAKRVTVSDNQLISSLGLTTPRTYIRLENVTLADVADNVAGAYIYEALGTLTGANNLVSLSSAGVQAAVAAWDASHIASARTNVSLGSEMLGDEGISSALGLHTLAAVPEPTTWATLIVGFLLLGSRGRRVRLAGRRQARPHSTAQSGS